MHIILAILGAAGVAVLWWYRLKMMKDAANEAATVIGRVQGHIRTGKLRKKAAVAPVTAIDDPVTAAATILFAIAAEDVPVSDALEKRVRAEIAAIAPSEQKIDEAVVYAKWATNQVADVATVVDKAATFLATRLDEPEKEQLVSMVRAVAPAAERHPLFGLRVELLRRRLGLVVER